MVINIVNYTKKIGQAVVLDNINVKMEEGKVLSADIDMSGSYPVDGCNTV